MNKRILITGATGMIGRKLLHTLQQAGHELSILSRKQEQIPGVKVYIWDIYKKQIDTNCMSDVDCVIHLAGENIADEKWTAERKREIIDSRTLSTHLLYSAIEDTNTKLDCLISASATGYYGDCGDEILTENDGPGLGFLAECCKEWEEAVDKGNTQGHRIVKLRTGFVLAKGEGALAAIEKQIKFFTGAPLGSGKQWVPWVHIDDIVAMYVYALENPTLSGAYNACAPFPVTNATLTAAIAAKLHRPVWPLNVPEKMLKLILGEMSELVLMSTNTSAQKLLSADFKFKYTQLDDALADIYS